MNSETKILGLTFGWLLVSLGIAVEPIQTYAAVGSVAMMISIFIYLWSDIINMSRRMFVRRESM